MPLGEQNAPDRRLLRLSPYSDAAIFAVTDGTVGTAAEGDDEQLIAVGAPVLAGAAVVGPGPNGRIDSLVPSGGVEVFAAPSNVVAGPSGDPALAPGSSKCETAVDASTTDVQLVPAGTVVPEGTLCITGGPPDFFVHTEVALGSSDFVRVGHERRFTLDPTSSDTDRDDISDGRETRIGLNPDANDSARFVDTDQDGLSDALEQAGWDACVANTCRHVKPSTVLADSDLDGLPDVLEHAIRSDPWRSDTDGDQLSDLEEFDLNNPVYPSFDAELHVVGTLRYYDQPSLDEAKRRCAGAAGCRLPSTSLTHTNPTATDSDGDGRSDYQEHYQSVIIYIDGKYARAAFSDPNLRDTDYDRLDDATELAQKTDPTSTDSDGDATDDRVELLSSEPLRRDPLTKDRLITLRYDRITWHDVDCWLLDDEEWTWNLQYQASENAAVQSYAQQVSAVEMDTNETSTVTTITGTPVRFVVKFSQSVILRGTLEEYDTDGVDSSYEYSENLLVSELELGDHVHEYTMNACGGTMVVTAAIAAE